MSDIQIFIGDNELELDPSVGPVALTFQINTLSDVKNQQASTTNQFKFPWTAKNKRIWNFANDPTAVSSTPYQAQTAKIVQSGVEIVPKGTAELREGDSKFGQLQIVSGNVDFFDYLDIKLRDMDFSAYDHIYNDQVVLVNMNGTSGLIYPIINFGLLGQPQTSINAATGAVQPTTNILVGMNQLRPALFVSSIINTILNYTKYTAVGKILTDALYLSLIVPSVEDQINQPATLTSLVKNIDVKGTLLGNQQYVSNANSTLMPVHFSLNDKSNAQYWNARFYCFTSPASASYKVNLNLNVYYQNTFKQTNTTINLSFLIYTVAPSGSATLAYTSPLRAFSALAGKVSLTQFVTLQAQVTILKGYSIYISMQTDQQNVQGFSYICAGSTVEIIGSEIAPLLVNDYVSMAAQLPDMTAREFLKDIFQKFGVICQTDPVNRVVTFGYFQDIIDNIPSALDWSAKLIDQDIAVTSSLGGYGQTNYLQYKKDDKVKPGYARGSIGISDTTLHPFIELFTSQFAASNMSVAFGGVPCAVIEKQDPYSTNNPIEFNQKVQPRILINKQVALPAGYGVNISPPSNPLLPVTFSTISLPTFIDPLNPANSLDYDYLRKTYYPALQQVLTRAKKLTVYLMLLETDIANLNFFLPVFLKQYGAYFYINKIENYMQGLPTKVELIKLY